MDGTRMTPNDQRTFIGQFNLDPAAREFLDLKSVCEQGNPWRCLIATSGSIHLGRRMTVRVDHGEHTGVIGITEGDYRWERPMTAEEVEFATDFDLSKPLPGPLTVRVDLRDPAWLAKPKAKPGTAGAKTAANNQGRGPNNRVVKSIRARQLAAIRADQLETIRAAARVSDE
jgi:hypothetical protein